MQDVDLIRCHLMNPRDENGNEPGPQLISRGAISERKVQYENRTGSETINERGGRWVHSSEYLHRVDVVFHSCTA